MIVFACTCDCLNLSILKMNNVKQIAWELVPLNYRSYDLPFVVRMMQPQLYYDGQRYRCLLQNSEGLSGIGETAEQALYNWANAFRHFMGKIPAKDASEHIKFLRQNSKCPVAVAS